MQKNAAHVRIFYNNSFVHYGTQIQSIWLADTDINIWISVNFGNQYVKDQKTQNLVFSPRLVCNDENVMCMTKTDNDSKASYTEFLVLVSHLVLHRMEASSCGRLDTVEHLDCCKLTMMTWLNYNERHLCHGTEITLLNPHSTTMLYLLAKKSSNYNKPVTGQECNTSILPRIWLILCITKLISKESRAKHHLFNQVYMTSWECHKLTKLIQLMCWNSVSEFKYHTNLSQLTV